MGRFLGRLVGSATFSLWEPGRESTPRLAWIPQLDSENPDVRLTGGQAPQIARVASRDDGPIEGRCRRDDESVDVDAKLRLPVSKRYLLNRTSRPVARIVDQDVEPAVTGPITELSNHRGHGVFICNVARDAAKRVEPRFQVAQLLHAPGDANDGMTVATEGLDAP